MKTCSSGILSLALSLWIGLASVGLADSGLGRHKKLYAVPRPGPVVVDGKLDDWDLSGQILMYVISETQEMQSARFALMYDDQALYLSGLVRDPTPLMNRHDPQVEADRGWDADACQFRIIVDPAQGYPVHQSSFDPVDNDALIHATLWYYTDRQEPVLHLLKSMRFVPLRPDWPQGVAPRDRFEAAYLAAEDGGGYTFEYRIPWSTLGVRNPPKAGDLVAGTVQFCWSAPDGLKTAGGSAWAYDVMSGPGFPYQSTSCWGKILFSEKGNLPKELVEEGLSPEQPLPLIFTYDLPEDGEATIQLFDEWGMMVRTLVASGARRAGKNFERWDGLDESGQPLPAGTYTCKGLYHQPLQTHFILSAHNSGQPPYKLDDNTGGWGGDHGTPTTACAIPDGMLLAWNVCESGWGIIRTDLQGKKLWGSKHSATHLATDGKRFFSAGDYGFQEHPGVRVFDLADARPLNFGSGNPIAEIPSGGDGESNVVTGLAYHDGRLYVAYGQRNLIGVNDADRGTLLETWKVQQPGRMAVAADGSLLVLSEGKVVQVRSEYGKGKTKKKIANHLDQPSGIAVGPGGTIYVANRGRLQNISVFAPDGTYRRSIGKVGGRPRVGRYEPDGILEPGGITVDQEGRLWVAETLDSPKRHSVWDLQTGTLVQEFFGASAYFAWAYMDPQHPDELYCHNVLWKVDLDWGTCQPVSTIWRSTAPNMIAEANPGGYAGHFRVMTARNGHQFGWGMVSYGNTLYLREGDLFKPFVSSIIVSKGNPFIHWPPYPIFEDQAKYPNGTYLWQDANDDQIIQEDELTPPVSDRGESVFNWIDEDLNAWCDAGYLFRPVRFEADGRPVYDFTKKEPIPFKGSNGNATSLWLDPDNGTVYTLNPGQKPGLAAWTRDGKMLWGYEHIIVWNEALSLPVVTPGKLWGLTMPLGVAGDFIGAATYFNPYHIFTRDGLYVGMVMRDGRTGGLGPDVTASETITGQLVKPEGMDRYFLLAGDQDGRVTEILGLETVKRLPGGIYIHREEDVRAATEALAQYQALLAQTQPLEIVRGRAALDLSSGVGKTADPNRQFTVRMAYDEQNLYLRYDVTSPHGLVNEITDPHIIFKGGNLLDLQMAADPAADPNRPSPASGDVRVLITRQNGRPFAVIYRPKVKDFTGRPIVLTSPTGQEAFDAIETTDRIGLEYTKTSDGFTAVATLPLTLLGWTPQPGQEVRLDVGYIFGNANGSQVALRSYWTNNSLTANVTNDIPTESRLEPGQWGKARVE